MARSPWTNLRRTHLKKVRHGPVDGAFARPELATMPDGVLDSAHRLESCMYRLKSGSCSGCGRDLVKGHTIFILTTKPEAYYLLCYECGIAAQDVLGLTAITEPVSVPAYGGGLRVTAE